MNQYEVTIRVTVAIETAEDETGAAEQALFNVDMCSGVVDMSVQDIRQIGE